MDIRVSNIEIEEGSIFEIRLYEIQVKSTCTIYELNSIMLSQKSIIASRYRVMLVHCGKNYMISRSRINCLITILNKTRLSS